MRRAAGAALLAALLAARPAAADPADPWWGPDKKLHFAASATIAAGAYGGASLAYDTRLPRVLWGTGLALGAGLAKEGYDLTGRGDPSWRDLTWDVAGTATGVGLSLLVDLLVSHLAQR